MEDAVGDLGRLSGGWPVADSRSVFCGVRGRKVVNVFHPEARQDFYLVPIVFGPLGLAGRWREWFALGKVGSGIAIRGGRAHSKGTTVKETLRGLKGF